MVRVVLVFRVDKSTQGWVWAAGSLEVWESELGPHVTNIQLHTDTKTINTVKSKGTGESMFVLKNTFFTNLPKEEQNEPSSDHMHMVI